jgi:hypothetical protein
MQQTLLALLGLLIVTLLSFSQQQADVRSQQQAIRAEYQQMALGVAKQSIEAIRAREYFDRAVRIYDDPDVEDFTKESDSEWGGDDCIRQNEFVSNPDGGHDCTAIEDFHDETMAMENADGLIVLPMPGGTVRFEVEFEVHYAEEDGSKIARASSGPTGMKEVTVRVQDCQDQDSSNSDSCDGEPLLPQPIVFSEVFSYSE